MSLDDFDDTIDRALAEHAISTDRSVPEFSALLSARQRRIRRRAAGATLGVCLLAVTAVAVARPGESPELVLSPPSSATAGPAPSNVRWFCSNPLGVDESDRELFGTCETAGGASAGDFACTLPLGKDEIGRSRFERCVEVAKLGPAVVGDDDQLYNPLGPLDVRADTYQVVEGDSAASIADGLCVSLYALSLVNGWPSAERASISVGMELAVPLGFDPEVCELRRYTISVGDSSRIAVAERFCVDVDAMDQANVETDRYEIFPPGLEIIIPPSDSDDC